MKKLIICIMSGLLLFSSITYVSAAEKEVKGENITTIQEEIFSINSKLQTLKIEYDEAIKNNNTSKQTYLILLADKLLDKLLIEFKKLENSEGYYYNHFTRASSDGEYYDYFTKSFWITRKGVKSLSIYPINLAWGPAGINKAWAAIKRFHSWNKEWYNEKSLYKQFMCHVNFAGSMKTPWNIEPSKKSINPITCN